MSIVKYSDASINGSKNLYNHQAVMQSIKTALYTQRGDRIFRPDVGCDLERILWSEITDLTALDIKDEIKRAIQQEPRATIVTLEVTPDKMNNKYSVVVAIEVDAEIYQESFDIVSKA